ncbi:MAG: 30S ribosomal protein S12 methylthiotransferase RimO [Sedimentisphaeraceae bacterium JB056]
MAKKRRNNRNTNNNINVGFISLGCPKNTVDSETMLGKLAQKGFCIVGDIELADAVIVNTCGFIESAKQEAIDQLKDAASYKENGRLQCVIAAGCLAQRMGKELLEAVPEIDAVVGLADRDNIDKIVLNSVKSFEKRSYLSENNNFIADDRGRLLTTPSHYAYLRISEGCDRKCGFCTIPSIRGKFRSKPLKAVAREAEELSKSGIKELIIIAQDSNYYGKDLGIENGLVELLNVLENFDFKWIRVMYLYPATVTEELIEKIASSDKILPYIDIPIQHINNEILKSMHRADTQEKTTALVESLRKKIPGIVLRTTVITGYPGETEENHRQLVDFIKWAKFDALGCFIFSPEEGTYAASLSNEVPQEIKEKRLEEIMLTQQEIAFSKNKAMIGKELEVIIDTVYEDGTADARYYGQAPEIDSICIITNCRAKPGQFIKVRVVDYENYDLIASQLR